MKMEAPRIPGAFLFQNFATRRAGLFQRRFTGTMTVGLRSDAFASGAAGLLPAAEAR